MDRQKRAEELAVQILKYARNELLVAFRFLDLALFKPEFQAGEPETLGIDGKCLRFHPNYIFALYKQGGGELNHTYLHSIFHCVFSHPFVSPSIHRDLWDLACDIAVEGILDELNMKQLETLTGSAMAVELAALQQGGKLTAERLYKRFTDAPLSSGEYQRLRDLFCRDEHGLWYEPPKPQANAFPAAAGPGGDPEDDDSEGGEAASSGSMAIEITMGGADGAADSGLQNEWQAISQRIQVDLETASQTSWGDRAANLLQNVQEVNREKYDYSDFLQKFAVLGEDMQINDDEFDYIFYTYGLQLYGNVPLIEPLEYKEVRKIKDALLGGRIVLLLSALLDTQPEFIGTPTELANKIDPDASKGITPKKVARQILQSIEAPWKAGIAVSIRRSNEKRLIELCRADSADFSGVGKIDPIDPAGGEDACCAAQ